MVSTKIIFFGILITMMILPFNMAEPTEAQESSNINEILDKMVIEYNNIEAERRHTVGQQQTTADPYFRVNLQKIVDKQVSAMSDIMILVEILAPIEDKYRAEEKPYPTISQLIEEFVAKHNHLNSIHLGLTDKLETETSSSKIVRIENDIRALQVEMDKITETIQTLIPLKEKY